MVTAVLVEIAGKPVNGGSVVAVCAPSPAMIEPHSKSTSEKHAPKLVPSGPKVPPPFTTSGNAFGWTV